MTGPRIRLDAPFPTNRTPDSSGRNPDNPKPLRAQLIIFSYDRAMQLEGLLASIAMNLSGEFAITIIYRTSSFQRFAQYQKVFDEHRDQSLLILREHGGVSFFIRLFLAVITSKSPLICFFVDDNIVINKVDVSRLVAAHPGRKSIATLRLGTNIEESMFNGITVEKPRTLEPLEPPSESNDQLMQWQFGDGGANWRYLGIEGTFFHRSVLILALVSGRCSNPNFFERSLNRRIIRRRIVLGVTFRISRIINIPANRVQRSHPNPINSDGPTIDELDKLFESGIRLDVEKYFGQTHNRLHVDTPLKFKNHRPEASW